MCDFDNNKAQIFHILSPPAKIILVCNGAHPRATNDHFLDNNNLNCRDSL